MSRPIRSLTSKCMYSCNTRFQACCRHYCLALCAGILDILTRMQWSNLSHFMDTCSVHVHTCRCSVRVTYLSMDASSMHQVASHMLGLNKRYSSHFPSLLNQSRARSRLRFAAHASCRLIPHLLHKPNLRHMFIDSALLSSHLLLLPTPDCSIYTQTIVVHMGQLSCTGYALIEIGKDVCCSGRRPQGCAQHASTAGSWKAGSCQRCRPRASRRTGLGT
jgi:hypothetical protein